jgi:hypothetical protein
MVLRHVPDMALLIWLAALPAQAQDVKAILNDVARSLGAQNLKTLRYSGSGSAYLANPEGARGKPIHVHVKSYIRELDLGTPASRAEVIRIQGTPPVEETQTTVIAATSPWETQFDIWLTPFGFLKGATANNATVEKQAIKNRTFDVVKFTLHGKYEISGFIDENHLIDRIQTQVTDPVLGETLVETSFAEYKEFGGVKFPTGITQKRNDSPVLIVIVDDVKPNVPVTIQAGRGSGQF